MFRESEVFMKNKTITKCSLVLWTLPYSQAILLIIGLMLIHLEIKLLETGLFIIIGMFLVINNSITCIIQIVDILERLISLKKQEKALGFNFNREMRINNVTSLKFESLDWYIDISNHFHPFKRIVFIVFKNGYIQSLGKKEVIVPSFPSTHLQLPFYPHYRGNREIMIVLMIDGSKQKIITYEQSKTITIFEAWYRRVNRKPQFLSKAKRKKEAKKERDKKI